MRLAAAVVLVALMMGCTTVKISEIDFSQHPVQMLCIERNEKVIVADFLSVVESGFRRHGVETAVYDGNLPDQCEYSLWYTAERGWDMAPYLDFAELRLRHRGKTIGTATYKHSGGFALNKWAGTDAKMNPVIDELLADFPAPEDDRS